MTGYAIHIQTGGLDEMIRALRDLRTTGIARCQAELGRTRLREEALVQILDGL